MTSKRNTWSRDAKRRFPFVAKRDSYYLKQKKQGWFYSGEYVHIFLLIFIQSLFFIFFIIYWYYFIFRISFNHCFNGFCLQRSLFSFSCKFSRVIIASYCTLFFYSLFNLFIKCKTLKKEGRAFRKISKNIYIFPTVKSRLLLCFVFSLIAD